MEETNDGAAAPANDTAAPDAPPKSLDALVERWWADFFPGSAVAAYTQAWNVAFTAKEALKALLKRSA